MTNKSRFFKIFTVLFILFVSITFMSCDQLLDFLLSNTGTTDVEITNAISSKTFYAIKLEPTDSLIFAKEATGLSLSYGKTHTFSSVPEGEYKVYVKTSSSGDYLLTNGGKTLVVESDISTVTREVTKLTELDSKIKIVNNSSHDLTTVRYRANSSDSWEEITISVSTGGNKEYDFPAGTYYLRLGYKSNGDFTTVYEPSSTNTFTTGSTTTVTAS